MENICEWENCKETAKFKAPAEKDNSKKFKGLKKIEAHKAIYSFLKGDIKKKIHAIEIEIQ